MNRALFLSLCRAHGLPEPTAELQFAPPRRWRLDWSWGTVALEIEGGAWTRGRHVRGKGYLADMEKYNAAAIMGIKVLRCTPQDVDSGKAFELVKAALAAE